MVLTLLFSLCHQNVTNVAETVSLDTRVLQKVWHWVWITSVLRFIKHIFITNLQSIPPLLKHIFVTFLPSRKKQINSLLFVSVGDTDNSTAKRTSRHIPFSRKHFLKSWK